jgi:hypothetical protein
MQLRASLTISDGCCKATTSHHRNPPRDLSRDSVAPKAGVVTMEAVDALVSKFALKKMVRVSTYAGRISKTVQGITEMSFESSLLCFAEGRKIGTLQNYKTPSGIRETRMPSTV